jgi:hypothetical protein
MVQVKYKRTALPVLRAADAAMVWQQPFSEETPSERACTAAILRRGDKDVPKRHLRDVGIVSPLPMALPQPM